MKIKISKSQWTEMGKKAGWMKKAQEETEQSSIDYENFSDLIHKDPNLRPEEAAAKLFNIPTTKHWEICENCMGRGTKDNPSLHSVSGPGIEGLSADDPDFMEEYKSGAYDVNCDNCHGSGKVLISEPRLDKASPEIKERYEYLVESYYSGQREKAAEADMRARGIQF